MTRFWRKFKRRSQLDMDSCVQYAVVTFHSYTALRNRYFPSRYRSPAKPVGAHRQFFPSWSRFHRWNKSDPRVREIKSFFRTPLARIIPPNFLLSLAWRCHAVLLSEVSCRRLRRFWWILWLHRCQRRRLREDPNWRWRCRSKGPGRDLWSCGLGEPLAWLTRISGQK